MKISNFFFALFFCLYSTNLSAEIFYIDIDKIINQTIVGKHINKEFDNLKKINDAKNLKFSLKSCANIKSKSLFNISASFSYWLSKNKI